MDPVPAWGGKFDFATNGASRLWQCLPENGKTKVFDAANPLNDLVQCCEMSAACKQTFKDARQCSQSGCIKPCMKQSAKSYMGCLIDQVDAQPPVCRFASLCVGQLTGNDSFDFAKTLAQDTNGVTASSCSSMSGFVDGLCEISDSCCPQCNAQMLGLVDCLVNDFLLPASTSAGSVTCDIALPFGQPCQISGASSTAIGRSSEPTEETETTVVEETETTSNVVEGVDISDCEEGLTLDFIVHNETHAADKFITCIGKKVGQVLSEAEGENVDNSEPVSAASSATFVLFGGVMLASSLWSTLA
jgi:hypothetical protein